MNYYNEFDKNAAAWLRNLIAAGHIAPGDVDERSIEDVKPSDLAGYTQCHFFAGIGVWSYALRRAGWRDDEPVWTGSCPCQPFSAAGKGAGFADERHLWPAWEWLIRHAKPRDVPVFGEQVASKDGLAWLDAVQADLEGQGYTVGALDLCAAGVGAPHIRQRLYFVADSNFGSERVERSSDSDVHQRQARDARLGFRRGSQNGPLADAERDTGGARRPAIESTEGTGAASAGPHAEPGRRSVPSDVGDASAAGLQTREREALERTRGWQEGRAVVQSGRSFWADCDWLPCIDGKARPVESGTFPLAHGAPARVGRLRAYGNAIVAPLAEEFIRAYREVRGLDVAPAVRFEDLL